MRLPARRRVGLVVILGLFVATGTALILVEEEDEGTARSIESPLLSAGQALVFGRIVDAKTKKPLPDAEVLIKQGAEPLIARANRSGRFQVVVSTGSPFAFETQAPGYMGTAAGALGGLCGRERFELNLSLFPAGTRDAPPAPRFLSGHCPVR